MGNISTSTKQHECKPSILRKRGRCGPVSDKDDPCISMPARWALPESPMTAAGPQCGSPPVISETMNSLSLSEELRLSQDVGVDSLTEHSSSEEQSAIVDRWDSHSSIESLEPIGPLRGPESLEYIGIADERRRYTSNWLSPLARLKIHKTQSGDTNSTFESSVFTSPPTCLEEYSDFENSGANNEMISIPPICSNVAPHDEPLCSQLSVPDAEDLSKAQSKDPSQDDAISFDTMEGQALMVGDVPSYNLTGYNTESIESMIGYNQPPDYSTSELMSSPTHPVDNPTQEIMSMITSHPVEYSTSGYNTDRLGQRSILKYSENWKRNRTAKEGGSKTADKVVMFERTQRCRSCGAVRDEGGDTMDTSSLEDDDVPDLHRMPAALDSILLGRTSKPSNVGLPYFAASAEVRHSQPNEEIHEARLRHFDNSERLLERNKKTMVRDGKYNRSSSSVMAASSGYASNTNLSEYASNANLSEYASNANLSEYDSSHHSTDHENVKRIADQSEERRPATQRVRPVPAPRRSILQKMQVDMFQKSCASRKSSNAGEPLQIVIIIQLLLLVLYFTMFPVMEEMEQHHNTNDERGDHHLESIAASTQDMQHNSSNEYYSMLGEMVTAKKISWLVLNPPFELETETTNDSSTLHQTPSSAYIDRMANDLIAYCRDKLTNKSVEVINPIPKWSFVLGDMDLLDDYNSEADEKFECQQLAESQANERPHINIYEEQILNGIYRLCSNASAIVNETETCGLQIRSRCQRLTQPAWLRNLINGSCCPLEREEEEQGIAEFNTEDTQPNQIRSDEIERDDSERSQSSSQTRNGAETVRDDSSTEISVTSAQTRNGAISVDDGSSDHSDTVRSGETRDGAVSVNDGSSDESSTITSVVTRYGAISADDGSSDHSHTVRSVATRDGAESAQDDVSTLGSADSGETLERLEFSEDDDEESPEQFLNWYY